MKLGDHTITMNIPIDLKLGTPTYRAATPQEAEKNWIERIDQKLRRDTEALGQLALDHELDHPAVIAARRGCLSLRETSVASWMLYYERYPVKEQAQEMQAKAVLVEEEEVDVNTYNAPDRTTMAEDLIIKEMIRLTDTIHRLQNGLRGRHLARYKIELEKLAEEFQHLQDAIAAGLALGEA